MNIDINAFGLLVNTGLASAVLALLLLLPLRALLARLNAYRFIWHPPLVDLGLFVLLWAATSSVATTGPFAHFLA